jgi:ABC-type amino acid transport system permease subunit
MTAAVLAVTLAAAVAAFQVALAAGAPLGAFAWGGRAPGRLPTTLRIASALSVPVYVVVMLVALGAMDVGPIAPPRWLPWLLAGVFGLSTLLNSASRSRPERLVMTPVAAGLALSFALLARGVAA